jgi:hypothetical protein
MENFLESLLGVKSTNDRTMSVIIMLQYASIENKTASVITQYGQMLEIPEAILGREVPITLYVKKKRYTFKHYETTWDQNFGCIIQIVWPKADDFQFLQDIRDDNSWRQGWFKEA